MRRLTVAAAMVCLVMVFGAIKTKPHSVMAGIQNVVTPTVHAQLFIGGGTGDSSCFSVEGQLDELQFEGWYVSYGSPQYLGPESYGIDLYVITGMMGDPFSSPFSINPFYVYCYGYWF